VETAWRGVEYLHTSADQSGFEAYLSGWSNEAEAFKTFIITSRGDLVESFEFIELGDQLYSPTFGSTNSIANAALVCGSAGLFDYTTETFDPDVHGRGLMEIQRQ